MTAIVVNADDFGFFDAVSRGIIDAAEAGIVTATGVMANGPALERWTQRLRAIPRLSIGVHLNVTLGMPLTRKMSLLLEGNGGQFPPKGRMAAALMTRRIPAGAIVEEWRAQIERCIDHGLALEFLNSHEHIHMHPGLYGRALDLARAFGIRHVRAPSPEWGPRLGGSALVRSMFMAGARLGAARRCGREPVLIGVTPSGRMDLDYCRWRLSRLRANLAYELMCHPGHTDAAALALPSLREYHDWTMELRTLLSEEFADLLRRNNHRLATFSELGAT